MGARVGRFELKYTINKQQYTQLKHFLPSILKLDPNNLTGKSYNVRSIYFDDPFDSAYYEKIDGVFERTKFRMRFYDFSDEFIKLEKKEKVGGITYKTDMVIDKSIVHTILDDPLYLDITQYNDPLYHEFVLACKTKRLTPKAIIEYSREAFLLDYEGIRICFDSNIRTSPSAKNAFEENLKTMRILDEPIYIFEVKYKRFLPNYVREIIELIDTTQTAFSKYSLSRQVLTQNYKLSR